MSNKDIYIVPTNDGWALRRPFSNRPSKKFNFKSQAVAEGKRLAKQDKSEFIELCENGRIKSKNSYG